VTRPRAVGALFFSNSSESSAFDFMITSIIATGSAGFQTPLTCAFLRLSVPGTGACILHRQPSDDLHRMMVVKTLNFTEFVCIHDM
jgi:hypothetical protein